MDLEEQSQGSDNKKQVQLLDIWGWWLDIKFFILSMLN